MITTAQSTTYPYGSHPSPPQPFLDLVGGPGSDVYSYRYIGYTIAEGIRMAAAMAGDDVLTARRILDFGCGCARVLRWFEDLSPRCELEGTDINGTAIDWCKVNIPFARFSHNNALPPLPFPDGHFDLIYGISVLTHLDEEYQFAWLRELQRIVRPGGKVMLSVHGDYTAKADLPVEEHAAFLQNGCLFKQIYGPDASGLPAFYQLTYHARDYVERRWTEFFRLRAIIRHGAFGHQDLVVMEKPEHGPIRTTSRSRPDYLYFDLPSGWLANPLLGATLSGNELHISGGAFHPVSGPLVVDLWIDGRRAASCLADLPSPEAGHANSNYPHARQAGFAAVIPIDQLDSGVHFLCVTSACNVLPVAQTFFFKEEQAT